MIVVSSCLAGIACRYNGSHHLVSKIENLVREKKAVLVCPEMLSGFSTPREPAEIVGGSGSDVLDGVATVLTKSGEDVTNRYIIGAQKALEVAKREQAACVVLKENSPSCGSSMIHDGSFTDIRKAGEGVTAALLRRNGITVLSDVEFIKMVSSIA
ncbi:DUF523 domain-containing protein [Ectobacillus sp. sgz5001026]|jgi:uncharacterized protein YbbK (DUF523 family)|uniref:DUF523 domain-containing protein n=1 Tax=Ectobacillus sp. sgz5001026 TaxID=3242473 RepID=UPI0036D39911